MLVDRNPHAYIMRVSQLPIEHRPFLFLSTRSLAMPVVSSYSTSTIIYQQKDINKRSGTQLASLKENRPSATMGRVTERQSSIFVIQLASSLMTHISINMYDCRMYFSSEYYIALTFYIPLSQPERLQRSLTQPSTQCHYYYSLYKSLPEVLQLYILAIFSCIQIHWYLRQYKSTRRILDSRWIT